MTAAYSWSGGKGVVSRYRIWNWVWILTVTKIFILANFNKCSQIQSTDRKRSEGAEKAVQLTHSCSIQAPADHAQQPEQIQHKVTMVLRPCKTVLSPLHTGTSTLVIQPTMVAHTWTPCTLQSLHTLHSSYGPCKQKLMHFDLDTEN